LTILRRVAVLALAMGLAAGCTTGAQTMEQDLAYQRFQKCRQWPTIVLQRIEQDGRVVVMGREFEQYPWLACMSEQTREQMRSKPDLVVPAPIVNPIPR
jgi:hypothetical protein